MARMQVFSSPLLLGFDQLEQLLDQATRAADGYPPYNIERFAPPRGAPAHKKGTANGIEDGNAAGEGWRITLAVAGFGRDDLEVTVEDRQLLVKGRQRDEGTRDYLHRGIAGRAFQRAFVLAEGMEVTDARLGNGMLAIDLVRVAPERMVRRIEVKET